MNTERTGVLKVFTKNKRHILFAILLIAFCWPRFGFSQEYNTGLLAFRQGNYDIALNNLLPLANAGHPDAQLLIASMFLRGDGVTADPVTSAEWLRRSAEQGHNSARAVLSTYYSSGTGVAQNYADAVYWARAAAENGGAQGQLQLGILYFEGRGVPQDYVKAHMWFNLAAVQNQPGAADLRDLIATTFMTNNDVSLAQTLARECASRQFSGC